MESRLLTLAFLALFAFFIWKLFVWVGDMAERRGQDRFLWQVVALFINPIGAMLMLWLFCRVRDAGE